jgi:4-hydroxy-4-methyl-2-oxoglutarate aldolase
MKSICQFVVFLILIFSNIVFSQDAEKSELAKGINFIETKQYSEDEDREILELYKNLRVADVSDGMDMVGLPGTGLVDPAIHPDWVDHENLSHVFRGIAITVRYVPTQKPDRPKAGEDFKSWEGHFYGAYSSEAFTKIIKPGTVVIIDDVEAKDIGSIGSYNILDWYKWGAVGVVTDASARDTDEIAIEKVPLYLRKKSRGIRPGRNELDSVNRPVVIGGVMVVPRAVAKQVALYAKEILKSDKNARKNLYESLNRTLDKTVK